CTVFRIGMVATKSGLPVTVKVYPSLSCSHNLCQNNPPRISIPDTKCGSGQPGRTGPKSRGHSECTANQSGQPEFSGNQSNSDYGRRETIFVSPALRRTSRRFKLES